MAGYLIQEKTLTDIADAIRVKTGGSEPININDFPNEIEQISTTTSADLIEYDENQTVKDKIDSIVVDIDTKINETKEYVDNSIMQNSQAVLYVPQSLTDRQKAQVKKI